MKKFLCVLLLLSLAGCASTGTLAIDRSALPALRGKTLVRTQHDSPAFIAMTAGKGMFAVAGVGAAVAAGNRLVKEESIADPAVEIGERLTRDLETRFGLSTRGATSTGIASDAIEDIVASAGGHDYALDVVTKGWGFNYDGFHFGDYIVGASVRMRLIDVAQAREIAAGSCAYDTKSAGKALVSQQELVRNDAAYIKQSLADATEFCVEKFRKEVF